MYVGRYKHNIYGESNLQAEQFVVSTACLPLLHLYWNYIQIVLLIIPFKWTIYIQLNTRG